MSRDLPDDPIDESVEEARDEEVRALLADARVDEPVPADVAARIDDVLAGLVAEREATTSGVQDAPASTGAVVDLASARRRRRTWLGAAAAAAVVVAASAALPDLLGGGSGDSDVSVADRVDPRERASQASPSPSSPDAQEGDPVVLTREGLAEQVEAHLAARAVVDELEAPVPTSGGAASEVPPEADGQLSARPQRRSTHRFPASGGCAWPGPGTREAATFDGEPATLVTRRSAAGTVVRVVTCADGESTVAARLVLDSDR